jgi:iron complex transport system substrate-binding protein
MSKKIMLVLSIVIIVMIACLSVLPGCKEEAQSADAAETQDESQAAVEEGEASEEVEEVEEVEEDTSIEVIDGDGNLVILDAPAEGIIAMAPSVLEIADGLGAMDKVLEIDSFTVMMQEPLAEGFEGVGDYQSLNVERIAELDPDLVVAITGGPEDDYNKLKELGIPVYRVIDVRGMDGVYEGISNISTFLDLEDKGIAMIEDLKIQVDEIKNKVEGLSDDEIPTVFYEVWNDPLMSAGTDTFISDLISIAGGVNIIDDLTGWPEYSAETLIEKNPDIIIAPMSLAADPSAITSDERFASIDAVINGRVYVVPDNQISRPSQNIIKGLQMLAKAIHPEIFGEFEIIE